MAMSWTCKCGKFNEGTLLSYPSYCGSCGKYWREAAADTTGMNCTYKTEYHTVYSAGSSETDKNILKDINGG